MRSRLETHGGSGWYIPVTEDRKQHKNKKIFVKPGENTPDKPKTINGKKVVNWIRIP